MSNRPVKPKPPSDKAIEMIQAPGESPSRTVARCLLDPATKAAGTLNTIYRGVSADSNINGYIAELQRHAQAVRAGNLGRSEAMLMAQAITLDTLFHTLTEWALNNAKEGGNATHFETCMRLAFKAQSQCRATNETLAEIKNPPNVAFFKQANISGGHQQVNNGAEAPRAPEIESRQTKLLRQSMANGWTPERRARQAELIRNWKPWERSTGPRTAKGKLKVSRNGYKGNTRRALRNLALALRKLT